MRLSLLLIPLLSLAALPARAEVEVKLQQLKDLGILPEEKLSYRPEEKLDSKRLNPFAERAKSKEVKAVESVETEELKIRRVFDSLKITGITKSQGKYSALLGDLIIEEGRQLEPIIQNQTRILRVTRVTDKQVEIVWVEGSSPEIGAPRRIVKLVELTPRVGVLLAAQPAGTNDPSAMTYRDENGKVIWPKKMAPDLEGLMDSLPPTSTAELSASEEAALMLVSPAETTPLAPDSPFTPAPGAPSSTDTAGTPAPEADVIVEPASWEESSPKPAVPSGN